MKLLHDLQTNINLLICLLVVMEENKIALRISNGRLSKLVIVFVCKQLQDHVTPGYPDRINFEIYCH